MALFLSSILQPIFVFSGAHFRPLTTLNALCRRRPRRLGTRPLPSRRLKPRGLGKKEEGGGGLARTPVFVLDRFDPGNCLWSFVLSSTPHHREETEKED